MISVQHRLQRELPHNLSRVVEDGIRLRLGKILEATDHTSDVFAAPPNIPGRWLSHRISD